MRFPIKLNRASWPKFVTSILPSAVDPRILCKADVGELLFTEAVSTLRFGNAFKATSKARFPLTIMELSRLTFDKPTVILDMGASDGTTSLDVMRAIPFEKYYVTDLNISVHYQISDEATWFYDEKGNCILMATDRWINYPDLGGAIFPFDKISQAIFSRAPKMGANAEKVMLINPELTTKDKTNIPIYKHNILETWSAEKADLIIAANVLNRLYFTTSELELALLKLAAALKNPGRIAIIDNRPEEKSTIFQIDQKDVRVEKRVNGGTEIEELALKTLARHNFQNADNTTSEKV